MILLSLFQFGIFFHSVSKAVQFEISYTWVFHQVITTVFEELSFRALNAHLVF